MRIGDLHVNQEFISLTGFASEGIWRLRRSPAHKSRQVRRLIKVIFINRRRDVSCNLITLCKLHTADLVITDLNLARHSYKCFLPQYISTRGLRLGSITSLCSGNEPTLLLRAPLLDTRERWKSSLGYTVIVIILMVQTGFFGRDGVWAVFPYSRKNRISQVSQ